MDSEKQYRGCGKQVAISCDECGIAVHPGCLLRVNYPYSGGKLIACSSAVSGYLSVVALLQIRDLIHTEFSVLKEE